MRRRAYLKGLGLGIFVTALILSLGSNKAQGEMSDDEIRQRAAKLGMVSENSLLLKEAKDMADNAQAKAMTSASSDNASKNAVPLSSDKAVQQKDIRDDSVSAGNVAANGEIIRPEEEKNKGLLPKEDKAATAGNAKDTANPAASGNVKDTAKPADTKTEDASSGNAKDAVPSAAAEEADDDIIVITVNSGESSISVANKMVSAGLINDARQFDSYLVLNGYDRRLVPGSHSIPKSASAQKMGEILTSH